MNEYMNKCINEWKHEWMHECMMNEWMNEWMNAWIDEWLYDWIYTWMNESSCLVCTGAHCHWMVSRPGYSQFGRSPSDIKNQLFITTSLRK